MAPRTSAGGGSLATVIALLASMLAAPVPAQAQPQYAGYLFTYFTGEGTANGEQVYFALSQGNNPLSWQVLNGGAPVLTSTLGTTGVRDPFIIRSPDGGRFYLIATDLKIFGNGDWDGAQRHGSRSILVWESVDLVTWTNQRLVQVAPPAAGNTWAPEAFYDESIGAYVVFWASKLYAADDPNHTGNTYHRMMYATTQDFRTFSAPQVWVDRGYSVIDSTVIRNGDTYYRFTKDERSNSPGAPCGKFILAETSTQLRSTGWNFLAECIGQGAISQGEGPLVFKSNTEQKWYLFIDEFGGRGYVPFETTNLGSGQWTTSPQPSLPASPRHGTVLPVTAAEHQRLLQALGGGNAVTLTARHSGKCADVIGQSTADGAEIAQYGCHGGANQRWRLEGLSNGYVRIVAQHSGKCLDVASAATANGARVLQWSCHSGLNQQWQVQSAGDGFVRLVARHSGRCLDVIGSSTADGVRLQQWDCHGGTNQQWRQNPV
jgi:hypothetical protein